jgi:hypothetical protein
MPERGLDSEWMPLARQFPPTVVRNDNPEMLKDGESPDAKLIGTEEPGYLYAVSTIEDDGTAWLERATISEPTNAPKTILGESIDHWHYWHDRVWGWDESQNNTTYMVYGSYGYASRFIYQGIGKLYADVESSAIKGLVPFGDNLAVFKTDYLYMIENAASPGNDFVMKYVRQGLGLTDTGDGDSYTNAIDMNGTLVFANSNGIYAFDGQTVKELTERVSSSLGTFQSYRAVTATLGSLYLQGDWDKNRVIGMRNNGSSPRWMVDLTNGGLYDYSSAGFVYTTPTFVADGREPVAVSEVAIAYKLASGSSATLTISVQVNDTWYSQGVKTVRGDELNGWASFAVELPRAGRRFALKITDMATNLRVSGIYARVKQGGLKGYSGK